MLACADNYGITVVWSGLRCSLLPLFITSLFEFTCEEPAEPEVKDAVENFHPQPLHERDADSLVMQSNVIISQE